MNSPWTVKYLVGVDSPSTDGGAIRFAAFVHEVSVEPVLLHATHVTSPRFEEAIDDATAWVKNRLIESGDDGAFASSQAIIAETPTTGLAQRAERLDVDALILGRQASTTSNRVVRLGRVARRTLRQLLQPTIVVPPDYRPHTAAGGPIMIATDFADHSHGAASFAKRLSVSLNRSLFAAHVVKATPSIGLGWVPAVTEAQVLAQLRLDGEDGLREWTAANAMSSVPTAVATGEPYSRLLDLVDAEKPSIVVCGSRRLSAAARVFALSIGSSLAATCRCPVAVVPPDWRPAPLG